MSYNLIWVYYTEEKYVPANYFIGTIVVSVLLNVWLIIIASFMQVQLRRMTTKPPADAQIQAKLSDAEKLTAFDKPVTLNDNFEIV